jgi:hypothetical protein
MSAISVAIIQTKQTNSTKVQHIYQNILASNNNTSLSKHFSYLFIKLQSLIMSFNPSFLSLRATPDNFSNCTFSTCPLSTFVSPTFPQERYLTYIKAHTGTTDPPSPQTLFSYPSFLSLSSCSSSPTSSPDASGHSHWLSQPAAPSKPSAI